MRRLAISALALALAACSDETSLNVVIGGDLRPGAEFDEVDLAVSLLGAQLWTREARVTEAETLPLTFVVPQPSRDAQVVDVTVSASNARRHLTEANRLVSFVRGRRVDVPMCLWHRCVGSDDSACLEGRCEVDLLPGDAGADSSSDVDLDISPWRDADAASVRDADSHRPADADSDSPRDAGSDAATVDADTDAATDADRDARDAGAHDAATDADGEDATDAHAVDADEPPFLCPEACRDGCEGDTCVFHNPTEDVICPGGMPCRVDCLGGTSCNVALDCGDATSCRIDCLGGSSCAGAITCRDAGCWVQCGGTGAGGMCDGGVTCGAGPCTVNCVGGSSCQLSPISCSDSCACDVTCTGGASCEAGVICPAGCDLATDDGCSSFLPGCDTCP